MTPEQAAELERLRGERAARQAQGARGGPMYGTPDGNMALNQGDAEGYRTARPVPPPAPSTALATRPYQPNFTMGSNGSAAPPAPSTALATRPYVPNFTVGARDIPPAPSSWAPKNPNVAPGIASKEAADFAADMAKRPGVSGGGGGGVGAAAGAADDGIYGAAKALGTRAAPALKVAGKAGTFVGNAMAIGNSIGAAKKLDEGDYAGGTLQGMDAVAGTASLPVSLSYAGGRLIGDQIYHRAVENNIPLADTIAGTLNQGVRNVGEMFGQKWGSDDDNYLMQKARERLAQPQAAATTAAPKTAVTMNGGRGSVNPPTVEQSTAMRDTLNRGGELPTNMVKGDIYKTVDPATGRPTYSGVDVKAGARMVNEDGRQIPQRGTMNTFGSEGAAMDRAILAQSGARGYSDAPLYQTAGGIGMGSGLGQRADADAAFEKSRVVNMLRDQVNHGTRPQQQAALAELARFTQGTRDGNNALEIARMREQGETTRAAGANAMHRDIAARSNDVALRGQDMSLMSHRMSNEVARAQMERQQRNDDRRFGLDVVKEQREAGALEENQRNTAETAFQKAMEGRYVKKDANGNSVPDAQRIARYRQGIDRSVAELGANGVHELAPRVREKLLMATDLLDKLHQDQSHFNPFSPDMLATMNPLDLTGLKYDEAKGKYYVTRGNAKGYGIPARYIENSDSARVLGTPTDEYNFLVDPSTRKSARN